MLMKKNFVISREKNKKKKNIYFKGLILNISFEFSNVPSLASPSGTYICLNFLFSLWSHSRFAKISPAPIWPVAKAVAAWAIAIILAVFASSVFGTVDLSLRVLLRFHDNSNCNCSSSNYYFYKTLRYDKQMGRRRRRRKKLLPFDGDVLPGLIGLFAAMAVVPHHHQWLGRHFGCCCHLDLGSCIYS